MSFGGLRIGSSGLAAAQRALETAGHNVANATTEGFSRQRVETSTAAPILTRRALLGPGASGQGVTVTGVTRAYDALATSNFRETSAQLTAWETQAEFYARAEQVLGPLDTGTTQALTSFWNSWEDLSQSPESATSRDLVMDAGRVLAQSLNDASADVRGLRSDLEADMAGTVAHLNDLAQEVAIVNVQIKEARARADTPNDLLDDRDKLLAELSRLSGAKVVYEPDGDARVTVNNLPLVDGSAAETLLVSGSPAVVAWQRDGSVAALGGELGSLMQLAGTGTTSLLASLDQIAVDLRDLVNAAHRAGFGLDGVDGRDFFQGGGAGDLGLDAGLTTTTVAASTSGAAADGNQAILLGGLRSVVGGSGVTLGALINQLQGTLGREASHATRQFEQAAIVVASAERSLAEISGVSVDEELTDMLRFQRAYEAAARVVSVMDQMLDRLINGMAVR